MESRNFEEILLRICILIRLKSGGKTLDQIREWIASLLSDSDCVQYGDVQKEINILAKENAVEIVQKTGADRDTMYFLTPLGEGRISTAMPVLKKHFLVINRLIMHYEENALSDIQHEMALKRVEWRKIRDERLDVKEQLLKQGMDKRAIKKNAAYKGLEKEQHHLSTVIKHIEKRLNRKIAALARNERGSDL